MDNQSIDLNNWFEFQAGSITQIKFENQLIYKGIHYHKELSGYGDSAGISRYYVRQHDLEKSKEIENIAMIEGSMVQSQSDAYLHGWSGKWMMRLMFVFLLILFLIYGVLYFYPK
jgi:hypothetical protein